MGNSMRTITLAFTFFIGVLFASNAYAIFCSYNSYGNKVGCASDFRACMGIAKRANGGECVQVSDTANLPKSLKATDPNAYCLWFKNSKKLVNMGCMAKAFCIRGQQDKEDTACIKGTVTSTLEVEKSFAKLAREKKSAEVKILNKESDIFSKGSPDEIINLTEKKFGSLEFKTQKEVDVAQNRIEPFCEKGNPKACYVLYVMLGESDFKNSWNRKAQAECADITKSYEYLFRSCTLGYRRACNEIKSPDGDSGEDDSVFIREPHQDGVANDEAKGVDCKKPKPPKEAFAMQEKCPGIEVEDVDASCIYKTNITMIDKMTYEQLVRAGEKARGFKNYDESISFYKKACELKSGTRPCIDWALDVYENDTESGRTIFSNVCNNKNASKEFISDCDNLARDFMAGE